jgi:hypothetical protein
MTEDQRQLQQQLLSQQRLCSDRQNTNLEGRHVVGCVIVTGYKSGSVEGCSCYRLAIASAFSA